MIEFLKYVNERTRRKLPSLPDFGSSDMTPVTLQSLLPHVAEGFNVYPQGLVYKDHWLYCMYACGNNAIWRWYGSQFGARMELQTKDPLSDKITNQTMRFRKHKEHYGETGRPQWEPYEYWRGTSVLDAKKYSLTPRGYYGTYKGDIRDVHMMGVESAPTDVDCHAGCCEGEWTKLNCLAQVCQQLMHQMTNGWENHLRSGAHFTYAYNFNARVAPIVRAMCGIPTDTTSERSRGTR